MSATPYDLISYAGFMQVEAHPDRLAALGRLLGIPTPPVDTCRVLELGCGDGSNLLPEAATLPRASFLGVDLSASAIARGQAALHALSWRHATLRQMDLLDFPDDLGPFDYIVAHGLYSWVPPPVRRRVLEICQKHLAPHGLAYISYNVLPGCRLRQVGWDLMRFHATPLSPPDQVAAAREILRAAADAAPDTPYGTVLRAQAQRVATSHESLVYHDDLAAGNTPFFFHEFAAQAAAHGLQYVCDARFHQDDHPQMHPKTAAFLARFAPSDLIGREQYADFITGRAFRRSVLCHAAIPLTRPVAPAHVAGLRFASELQAPPEADLVSDAVVTFHNPQGKSISLNTPLAKAALVCLRAAWPQSVPFEELFAQAREKSADTQETPESFSHFLLTALAAQLVSIHTLPAPIATAVPKKPRASALARWQARQGLPVTTLIGTTLHMQGDSAVRLLTLLDGRHDLHSLSRLLNAPKPALLAKLQELAQSGMFEA